MDVRRVLAKFDNGVIHQIVARLVKELLQLTNPDRIGVTGRNDPEIFCLSIRGDSRIRVPGRRPTQVDLGRVRQKEDGRRSRKHAGDFSI